MRQRVLPLQQIELEVIAGGTNLRPAQIDGDNLFSHATCSLFRRKRAWLPARGHVAKRYNRAPSRQAQPG